MARSTFGGTANDLVLRKAGPFWGPPLDAVTVTFWDSETGGTRYTDLLLDGQPVSSVRSGVNGQLPAFQGPDGVAAMWADDGDDRHLLIDRAKGEKGDTGPGGSDADVAGYISTAGAQSAAAVDDRVASGITGKVAKGELVVNVKDHGAVGDGAADDTAAIQAALDAAAGQTCFVPDDTYNINLPLTVPADTELRLAPGAVINNTVETQSAVVLSAGSILRGGTIKSPAVFDVTTGAWTYAVVYVTGNAATVDGVTLDNVPHVGIGIKEVDDALITNCRIYGNYPSASYTGVETGHFGIALDANVWGTGSGSGPVIEGNHIHTCVQGVSLVNHGTGAGYGSVVVGNRFFGCHNHGIYSQIGMEGDTITGNAFFFCQKPVVTTGRWHVVDGNTMVSLGTGAQRDQAGISCRNAEGCVVADNTIYGESTSTNIGIQLDQNGTGDATTRNTISGNMIHLTGAGGQPAIRVGNASSTITSRENRVEGNIIHAPGPNATSGGVIDVVMATGATGTGNVVEGNILVCTANSAHVRLVRQQYATVSDNYLRHDADAAATTTIIQVRLEAVTDSTIEGNKCVVTSAWGANTTMHAIREMDTTCDRNILGPSVVRHDLTKVVSSTEVVQAAAGNASQIVNRVGEHASATTLGTVTGKVEVRDGKGAILGYLPVYGSIT
jgi:hypothetical protein